MSDALETLLRAGTRPRESCPRIRALFGDAQAYPVFRDIAAMGDEIVGAKALAWPMRFVLPPQPPQSPNFAGLACLYCNHLVHLLAPASSDDNSQTYVPAYGDADLLAFLLLAAHGLSRNVPRAILNAGYLDDVNTTLTQSVRVTHTGDDVYWKPVVNACAALVGACRRGTLRAVAYCWTRSRSIAPRCSCWSVLRTKKRWYRRCSAAGYCLTGWPVTFAHRRDPPALRAAVAVSRRCSCRITSPQELTSLCERARACAGDTFPRLTER